MEASTEQTAPETPPEGAEKDRPDENVKAELQRRKERQEAAEREAKELRDRLQEFEDSKKSVEERERLARERAEQQLSAAQTEITNLRKGAWVRSAATSLGFHDPEDAVAHLTARLGHFEDETDAKRAVKKLAQDKEHLVQKNEPDPKPRIGKVLEPQAAQQQPTQISPAQAAAMSANQAEREFAEQLAAKLGQIRTGWHESGTSFLGE